MHTVWKTQFFDFEGEHLGLVSAAQVLELGETGRRPSDELAVVVIGSGARRYGLVVDAIRGEQSLAVQPLEPIFGKLRDIASCALLDDGAPVLILDVPDLLLSIDAAARRRRCTSRRRRPGRGAASTARILVVDDSLTVREMQRKLLPGAATGSTSRIDGIDGWNVRAQRRLRPGDHRRRHAAHGRHRAGQH
jgi:two-component system sensor histidine kinase and response regulator WspE